QAAGKHYRYLQRQGVTDEPISAIVGRVVSHAKENSGQISIQECVDILEHRSILLAIFLFALVNSLPILGIPGFSTVTGIPIMLLSAQIIAGRKTLWLPKRVLAYKL